MAWLRLLTSPLTWAAAAALAGWLAWGQMQRANEAVKERRAAERAAEEVGRFLTAERARSAALSLDLEEVANAPDTFGCGPAVHGALDRLRAARPNP